MFIHVSYILIFGIFSLAFIFIVFAVRFLFYYLNFIQTKLITVCPAIIYDILKNSKIKCSSYQTVNLKIRSPQFSSLNRCKLINCQVGDQPIILFFSCLCYRKTLFKFLSLRNMNISIPYL